MDMSEDLLARVGRLEAAVSDMRADVSSLKGAVPRFATKGDIGEVKALIERTEASVARAEGALVKWIVGTALASTSLAVGASKLLS